MTSKSLAHEFSCRCARIYARHRLRGKSPYLQNLRRTRSRLEDSPSIKKKRQQDKQKESMGFFGRRKNKPAPTRGSALAPVPSLHVTERKAECAVCFDPLADPAREVVGRHPFTRVYPSRVRAKGAQSGGRVRVRVRVRVSQGCRRFAKGDGRRGTKLGPGVPKLGPLGPRGILSTRRHYLATEVPPSSGMRAQNCLTRGFSARVRVGRLRIPGKVHLWYV